MPSCAVRRCKSWNMRDLGVRFFSFPKDSEVQGLWIKACDKTQVNCKNARICSLHFTDDDWSLKDKLLKTELSKCSLDKKAVPSKHLPIVVPNLRTSDTNKIRYDNRVKPKNVLALNEKVAAIRRYEIDPVYKSVGRYFNCSPDQIKRIIKQKDEILNEWENRTKKSQINLAREMKTVKISFLGKAVHEWIRRMMYYSDFNLTDALIQTMAIEFKKALGLPNFFPDKTWVASFRNTYNLKNVNTKTLDIGYQESHSVQIRDILSSLQAICGSTNGEAFSAPSNPPPDVNPAEPLASVFIKEENQDCDSQPSPNDSDFSAPSTSLSLTTPKTEPEDCAIEQVKEEVAIKMETDDEAITYEEAMQYVKQLEEFALLKENFRLIGLVERLEEALKEQA